MAVLKVVPNYKPHAKQILLHNAPVSYEDLWIILYGGARGGGKSAGILADAFMFAQSYPGAKCCILRESLDAVKQSFLDKLPTLFPQTQNGVKLYDYREKSTSWYPSRTILFPNGSYITLQRVANYQEAKAKQGWEFHYLAIDEVTKQEERTVNYLLTCVRSAEVINQYTGKPIRIPTKVVFGCNPGGIGHAWVKERFILPCTIKYGEHHEPVQTKDFIEEIPDPHDKNKKIKRHVRFIPASSKDNPYLNDSYVGTLNEQPEHMRQMDLFGCWDVVAGKMFDLKEEQKCTPFMAKELLEKNKGHIEIYISIDWGYKPSYHSAHWYAVLPDHRVLVFKEMYGQDLIFEDFVKEIAAKSEDMYISGTCLPHDMFRGGDRYRDDNGRIIGETKSDVFDTYGLSSMGIASGKGKVQMRFDKIHSATKLKSSDGTYKFMISRSCPMLIEEMEQAVYDEIDPTQIARGCRDHAIDDFGLFLVFYSDDIEPLGFDELIQDNRGYLQRILEEDERMLEEAEADETYINSYDDF